MTTHHQTTDQTSNGVRTVDFAQLVTPEMERAIHDVPFFRDSQYAGLKVAPTLEYYTKRFVRQLPDFTGVTGDTVIADVGTGYAWLPMAFALSTPARIIAVEPDGPRLEAAEKIAKILGIADRIDWRVGTLGNLPLRDREAAVVYCIEVLEHIYRAPDLVPDLPRVSGDLLVVTTPNLWFPVVSHDTGLPFCHWLPRPWRKVYAGWFGRDRPDIENDNLFWSPRSLRKQMPEFHRVSAWLHYESYAKYKAVFPYYLPYGDLPYVTGPGRAQALYYEVASKLGGLSAYVLPSLSCVLRRHAE